MSESELTMLPKSVGRLTNLTELNLSHNGLKILPESIGNLTNLTDLNLNFNELTMLENKKLFVKKIKLIFLNNI